MLGCSDEQNAVLFLQCVLMSNWRKTSQKILNSMNSYFIRFRTEVLFSYTMRY